MTDYTLVPHKSQHAGFHDLCDVTGVEVQEADLMGQECKQTMV